MASCVARVRALGLAIVVALGLLAMARPLAAIADQPAYIETPVHSLAPDSSSVRESYVSLYAPLPAADGPHPAACDRVGYLRFRGAAGPRNPADADAIFVAQPGIFEGPAAFDQVARHTIIAAASQGYHVEFWALNPRSNCLIDNTGIAAAEAARNPMIALNYYYNGATVDGQTFAGYVNGQDAAWLSHDGLAQTVQDEYTVISRLPPAVRRTKVLCGGHSLGGIVTGAFANWDFSGTGNPADAGYNQCAGYFALDTRFTLSSGLSMLSRLDGSVLNYIFSAISSGFPYIDFPPITPETLQGLAILGLASYFQPNAESTLLKAVPNDSNYNFTLDFLVANSWGSFLLDSPNPRDFNVTNQAALGTIFGNNSQPIGILRASVGVPTGGPVVEKSFPLAYGTPSLFDGLLGGDLVAPAPASATPNGPLYSWLNYNQVPTPGPSPEDDPGQPYTSAASQVSDITQLSRTLFDSGEPFTGNYFPTQLVLDIGAAGVGDRSGSLAEPARTPTASASTRRRTSTRARASRRAWEPSGRDRAAGPRGRGGLQPPRRPHRRGGAEQRPARDLQHDARQLDEPGRRIAGQVRITATTPTGRRPR